ncbi:alpha/beta fold hydrolase [Haloterrigena salifodinae]|uniref:Alpha/beta fold hydrolase n=1 Tax=Haloterrigena salifodinae TaxID=2675099 RepID=A0A8T8E2I6_9EURY|nr:alpha/beta fold hydrolase [Haloterrigena salifodinae]QRV15716.1 alpha/beta fold hydrolase [Haloterrigena salifodinae]
MTRLGRRQLLSAVSTTTVAALAGCSDLLDEEREPDSEESTDENESPDEPEAEKTDDSSPETPAAFARQFVEKLAADRFEEASNLTPTAGPIPAGNLERVWMGYTAVHGEFEEITAVGEAADLEPGQTRAFGDAAVIDVTMTFERGEDGLLVGVKDDAVAVVDFPVEYERPTYVDPDSFATESVTVPAEGCHLDGIATVPTEATGSDDVPGVVLVHGSTPTDKNYQNGSTQLFRDLAEGLASCGIAVLRYDKRTYSCIPDLADRSLDRTIVDDALVAVDQLRALEGVDADRIVVVGHSLGGMAAPRIAARDGSLAGAVGLAAPARPLYDVFLEQYEHRLSVGEHDWEQLNTQYDRMQEDAERIRNGEYQADEVIAEYPGALWQSLEDYDHVDTARDVDVPLRFLQGRRDFQVSPENDFELWRTELEDRPATTFESYDGLDHLFMSGEGPSVPYETMVRNNVEEAVIDDLVAWIDGR